MGVAICCYERSSRKNAGGSAFDARQSSNWVWSENEEGCTVRKLHKNGTKDSRQGWVLIHASSLYDPT